MNFPRLPHAALAMAAIASLAAMPAFAASDPVVVLGPDPDRELYEFALEFDAALEEADAEFGALQLAHAGQLSPKDSCHRHKAAGERHWHKQDTSDRAGPCVKVNGQTYRLANHAICAATRVELVEAKKRWGSDYKRVSEALKDCIIALPPPKR